MSTASKNLITKATASVNSSFLVEVEKSQIIAPPCLPSDATKPASYGHVQRIFSILLHPATRKPF